MSIDDNNVPYGSASSLAPQVSQLLIMQPAATANGNGTAVPVDGCNGAQQVEILESGGGTCSIALQGSLDGNTWHTVGYQQVDATAAPARAVAGISVAANSAHVYQVLDPYRFLQAVVSSVSGGCVVTARVYLVPA